MLLLNWGVHVESPGSCLVRIIYCAPPGTSDVERNMIIHYRQEALDRTIYILQKAEETGLSTTKTKQKRCPSLHQHDMNEIM